MDKNEPNIDKILKMGMENDPNYDEMMEMIKVSCPVKKINIDIETPGGIIGMFLLSEEDPISLLESKADLEDLNDNTILFFTNQHIVELSNIINGMLGLMKLSNIITNDDDSIHKAIIQFINLCKNPIDYNTYKRNVRNWRLCLYFKNFYASEDIINRIINILDILPFISYNNLDEIAKESISNVEDKIKEIQQE